MELADRQISGSVQPYHTARAMKFEDAQAFLARCADQARTMAGETVRQTIDELAAQSYAVAGACVLLGSGRTTHDLAAILASHPAVHTAEGEFYRAALRSACESCGLPVLGIKERELFGRTATAMLIDASQIEHRLSAIGKTIGPPWRQDEKLCALGSWLLLSATAK
jgi:hypothetical protein